MHLYPYLSNVNKTVWKLHKIIQKRGGSFGRIPSNERKGITKVGGPRTLHILLDIVFPTDSMPLAKIDIYTYENLYYLDYANASFISSFSL